MKRKKNPDWGPATSFVERLKNALSLKIKYAGQYITIPHTIMNQARLFALQSVGVDYDVFRRSNPLPSAKVDKAIQKAFEDFLEGYVESVMPLGNPSTPRSEQVFRLLGKYFDDADNNSLSKWHTDPKRQIEVKRVMKSGVMKVVHNYLDGEVKIKVHEDRAAAQVDRDLADQLAEGRRTKADFETQRESLKRSGFVMRVNSSKDEQGKVIFHRTVRNVATIWQTMLTIKLLETNGEALKKAVEKRIVGMTYQDLTGDGLREGLLADIAKQLEQQLSGIDLLKTIGAPKEPIDVTPKQLPTKK